MCVGIVQKPDELDYVERTFTEQIQVFADPAGPRFNTPPGVSPLALHRPDETPRP